MDSVDLVALDFLVGAIAFATMLAMVEVLDDGGQEPYFCNCTAVLKHDHVGSLHRSLALSARSAFENTDENHGLRIDGHRKPSS